MRALFFQQQGGMSAQITDAEYAFSSTLNILSKKSCREKVYSPSAANTVQIFDMYLCKHTMSLESHRYIIAQVQASMELRPAHAPLVYGSSVRLPDLTSVSECQCSDSLAIATITL